MNGLARIFPAFDWLSDYSRDDLRGDASAGLTVGVMLIPQSMAYAMLAGVDPIYGLYAGCMPLIIYALLGTSRHLAIGPVTVDMLILGAGVGVLAAPAGGIEPIELAVLVALMTGAIEILMGVLRLGFMVNFLSRPVIAGFMTAAPLIIAFNQLGSLTGIEGLPDTQMIHVLIWEAFGAIETVHPETLAVGLSGVVLLLVVQTLRPKWPGALFWVVIAISVSWGFGLGEAGVTTVHDVMEGDIPTGLAALPFPELPTLELGRLRQLAPTALTLAVVQFMYVMSLGQAFASEHKYEVDANRELFAIGAANIVGSIFHAVPVSGSFSRSAVNHRAGAHTPASNVVAAALVALALVVLTPLLAFLPVAALAAIIMVACVGMIDVPELKYLLETRWVDGAVALLTFAATLAIGIQPGILIGVGASIVVVLWDLSQPNVVELGHVPGTQEFRDVERNDEAESISDIHIVRIDARFNFANAKVLKQELLEEAGEDGVRALILDTSGVNDLDTTATASLTEVVEEITDRGIEMYVAGAKGPVRDVMRRSGLAESIGEEQFFLNPHLAVSEILERWEAEEEYPPIEEEHQRADELEEAREKLRAERKRAEEQRSKIAHERRTLREEIADHEAEHREVQSRRGALIERLHEATTQRERLRSERRQMEERQEALEAQQEELEVQKEQLEVQQKELASQEDKLEADREEVQARQQELEEERERIVGEQKGILEERARLKAEIAAHEAERAEIVAARKKLQSELREAAARRLELREERKQMEAQTEQLQAERQRLRDERKRLEAERKKTAGEGGGDAAQGGDDAAQGAESEPEDGNDAENAEDGSGEASEEDSEDSNVNRHDSEEFDQPI